MKKQKILVVENERIVAEDIKMSLQRLGYAVPGIAITGEEAIQKAEKTHPDLVLMDVVLEREMDGIEAASIIRSRLAIPIVYLTAYADDKTLERVKKTEPFGYILKPFEDRDLHSTIEIAIYKHKMENMLKESGEKYHRLYSSMNEGVCLHEVIYNDKGKAVDYRITDINPAYELITGLKKEKVVGSKATQLYGTDKPPFLNIYAKVAASGEPASIETYFPPLKKFVIISAFSPAKGKFATVFTDITERYNTERELMEAKNKAEKALEKLKKVQSQLIQSERLAALGRLSAGVAHEINNPLSIISGHTQMLLMDKIADSSELKKILGIIKKQVDRASKITHQLLQFSKRTSPEFKKLDVNEIVNNTLALLKHQLTLDDIKIVKQVFSKRVSIFADPSQLQQVFLNLMVNASQAMPKGGTLTVNAEVKDANTEINFTDTGCGIPEENLDKLFEPFFTTKENGAGLGLSIVYGIIKAHKGSIKVKSKEGKGSTFTIILPLKH